MSDTGAGERRDLMLELWGETLEVFRARLKADKKGQLSASYMATITAFLAQSGISAESVDEAKEAIDDLATATLIRDIEEAAKTVEQATAPGSNKPTTATATGAPLDQPFAPRPPTRA